jgi:hypothetical protein
MVGSCQHVDVAVDEYRMSWSDAVRVETEFLDTQPMHRHCEDGQPLDCLGRGLGRERSFTWILGVAAVRADDARRIISNLRAAFRPIPMESAAGRAAVPSRD